MDAITIQILRNKIASLVDEMHYHFYRSGYSTIIRESRDFSCVILDRTGRLIVGADSPEAMRLAANARCQVESFGLSSGADWRDRMAGGCGLAHACAISRVVPMDDQPRQRGDDIGDGAHGEHITQRRRHGGCHCFEGMGQGVDAGGHCQRCWHGSTQDGIDQRNVGSE